MVKRVFGEIRMETLEPMQVACFRATGKEPEHESLGYLKRWVLRQGVRDPGAVRIFGFDVDVSDADRKKGLRGYEAWASVPAGVRPSEGVEIRSFPGGRYAVLRVRNPLVDPFARIPPAWEHLWEWARKNDDLEPATGPCLEEEIQGDRTIDLDLYLPVTPTPRRGAWNGRPTNSRP
jgi:DNA gyrase inhibitor GyrI